MQAHAAKVLRGMPTFSAIACKHSSGVQWRAGFREGRAAAGARNLTQIRLSEAQQCPGGHTEPGALCSEHRHDKNKSPHPRQGRRAYLIAICLGCWQQPGGRVSQNARRQYFVKTPQVSSVDAIESSAWAWVDVSDRSCRKEARERSYGQLEIVLHLPGPREVVVIAIDLMLHVCELRQPLSSHQTLRPA